MTVTDGGILRASILAQELRSSGLSPFFGTPCGILAPLYADLARCAGLTTVAREDNAVGLAAGCALAGRNPVILMQNSGLGQSVNALASLVGPYRIPLLLVVGMRGTGPDLTEENKVMGDLTEVVLWRTGIAAVLLDDTRFCEQAAWGRGVVMAERNPAALLVPPTFFGWRP